MFDPQPSTKSEPAINVPWSVMGLCGFILGLYALQSSAPDQKPLLDSFALVPILLNEGRWDTVLTYMFLHNDWTHAGINTLWALVFAVPVARAFGTGINGLISFFSLYITCGVVAGLGFALVRNHDAVAVIGASGAVSGLMGAAMRLRYRGILLPLKDKTVIGFSLVYIAINLASVFINLTPGGGASGVAWQTHLFGYGCGLFLIKPWVLAFHRGTITQI